MKLDSKSLTVKMWTYFILFTVIILIVLWCLQIIFISSYYKNMKLKQIKKVGNHITDNFDRDDIESVIDEYSFKNNLFTTVLNEENYVVMTTDAFGGGTFMRTPNSTGSPPNDPNFKNPPEGSTLREPPTSAPGSEDQATSPTMKSTAEPLDDVEIIVKDIRSPDTTGHIGGFERFKQLIIENSGKPVCFIGKSHNNTQAYYASSVKNASGEQLYLLITSPLPPIDSTVEILKGQLIIITGFLFILASLIAYLFANRLAKPVIKLTDTAGRLAAGDFSVVFEEGGYSEINQLADTLNFATKEMSRVDELRKDLIANISHDLRTPLTIIKFYGEMIHDVSGNNPEKRLEHSELIMKESDKLTSLVNELLDYSKIQSDNFELELKKLNISAKLEDIVNRFHEFSEKEGYVFNKSIEKDLFVTADELQIERVIYNLISNAVNYTGDNKTVSITLASSGGNVRFEVSDTGVGIPQDQIKNIWERYYKVKETHRRAVVGNGLGLSIVKNILEKHNAAFGVKSAVNEGSTFWFELGRAVYGRLRE